MLSKERLCFPLLLALCVCSLVSALTLGAPGPARAAAVLPTGLHVVGNQILDANGKVFTAHGVDRMGTEYACSTANAGVDFDGPVTQAAVSAMLSWDINSVRVPLNEDCWLGINGEPANGLSAAQYKTDIVNWVNLLNQNGLVVILDLHWNNSGTNQSTGQEPMPDLDHAPAFWTSVANTFKNNSSVIFDLYNEPYPGVNNATTTGWSCWKNGSTAASTSPCADIPFAVAGMQTLITTVRATGATNVLMLGGLTWANDLTGWLANEPTDPDHGLVASFHVYNFNGCVTADCWNTQVAPVAAQVPVIAGEIGENDCLSTFIDTLMPWLDAHGIGYLAWTWTVVNGGTCPNSPILITDYTGTPTGFGAGFKAHLLALAGGNATPTPSATSGGTPTATPTGGTTPTPTPTQGSGGSGCKVTYTLVGQWQGGFQASLAITNTGTTSINGWTLVFSFANGQTITQIWNASETQSGSTVTVTNLSYDGTIAPGTTLSSTVGFLGSWNGTNAAPTSFTLNGVKCS